MSLPLERTVYSRDGPETVPTGRLTLPRLTASEASSTPMPLAAMASGSSWTRTAYFLEP